MDKRIKSGNHAAKTGENFPAVPSDLKVAKTPQKTKLVPRDIPRSETRLSSGFMIIIPRPSRHTRKGSKLNENFI